MVRIDALLAEYGASHENPANKLIHWICVPLIVWSLLGLLWSVHSPAIFAASPVPLNWALLVVALAMVYYLIVSPALSAGILMTFLVMLVPVYWLEQSNVAVWKPSVVIFVVAWTGQFIGHKIEGKKPSFFKDLQFLLIGPLWLLSFVYKKWNIPY